MKLKKNVFRLTNGDHVSVNVFFDDATGGLIEFLTGGERRLAQYRITTLRSLPVEDVLILRRSNRPDDQYEMDAATVAYMMAYVEEELR